MAIPDNFQSTGYMAAGLQLSVAVIQTALQVLDIKPSYFQNGIAFYGDDARQQLLQHFIARDMLHHIGRGEASQ